MCAIDIRSPRLLPMNSDMTETSSSFRIGVYEVQNLCVAMGDFRIVAPQV